MNKNLVSYYDKLADEVVLTIILNGATNISKTYIVQTLLEAHNAGFSIGVDARHEEQTTAPVDNTPRPTVDLGEDMCG